MKYLDETMGIIMKGMEVIGTTIGDPPNPEKIEPKYDNPATFAQSLQERDMPQEDIKRR